MKFKVNKPNKQIKHASTSARKPFEFNKQARHAAMYAFEVGKHASTPSLQSHKHIKEVKT